MSADLTHARLMDARQRPRVLSEVSGSSFDLVVIGGGINGAGIAADAALRGLEVLLLEQRDLGFGTSSRSSKLIHGGLRYLEHYQFRLVFEGTNERAALRRIAPHLVRPLLFSLPVYEGARHPLWKMDVGLWMYDGLSLFKTEKRHVTLRSQKRMLEREPLLRGEGLTGGIIYYDCATDDGRLTLENAIFASRLGSPVLTRARVVGVEQSGGGGEMPVTVRFIDEATGVRHSVHARGAINATGVWTDNIRKLVGKSSTLIRPTKGVHIVVDRKRLPVSHAAALLTPQDGRVFFAIPWDDRTVIGTTDTDDSSDPSELKVTRSDVDYLLGAANYAFPTARLRAEDVMGTWAGLRPLVQDPEAKSASEVPREHQIITDGRLVTVAGGKLTTYRRMAAETVDAAVAATRIRCGASETEHIKLPGADGLDLDFDELAAKLAAEHGLPSDVSTRLADVYGIRAIEVAQLVSSDRSLADRVHPDQPVIFAEVVHAVDTELALDVDDILVRRTSLALRVPDDGRIDVERVSKLMGERLGWTEERRRQSLARFEHELDLMFWFRRHDAPQSAASAG